jgi:starch synthase
VTSDILVTVSQGYAAEITGTPQDGRVDMLLAQRAPRLRGIVNGIDVTEWDPATDIHLAQKWVSGLQYGGPLALTRMECVHPGLVLCQGL